MPAFGSVSRRELVEALRQLGLQGPYPGGKHEFMVKGTLHITIPNPHRGDISSAFLSRILRQADITRQEWEAL